MERKGETKRKKLTETLREMAVVSFLFLFCVLVYPLQGVAQSKYENLEISDIRIVFTSADPNIAAAEQFRTIVKNSLGDRYSTVKIRKPFRNFTIPKIISVEVSAEIEQNEKVSLKFTIRRTRQVEKFPFSWEKASVALSPKIKYFFAQPSIQLARPSPNKLFTMMLTLSKRTCAGAVFLTPKSVLHRSRLPMNLKPISPSLSIRILRQRWKNSI